MDDERLLHLSNEQWAQVEAAFPQRRGRSGFERKIHRRLGVAGALQHAAGARKKRAAATPRRSAVRAAA